jgi:hypothetical protein
MTNPRFLAMTAALLFAATPAHAQTARAKNDSGKKCWIQTDAGRGGFYGSCKNAQAPNQRSRQIAPPVALPLDPRENSSGGGGGY